MTRRELMQLLANAEYWRDREETQRATYIRTEEEEMREINQIYNEMYRWAEREISAFYGRYADAEGIDITEAKRRVSQMDIEAYERLAKQYVADRDFSDRANQEMRLYNATMRINRMELLKAQMGLKMVDGFNDIDKHYEKIATDRAVQEIQRMSGILGNTLTDVQTAKIAKNIVNADFYNATFSERIWMHADNLKDALATELNKGFISGVSSQKMAQNIKKQFEVSYKDAHRLVVTELRRIQTDVAKDNYERQGIEEYEYMAVNPNACPICKDLDGKVYKVSEMQAGLNAPPIHPNCHCTTAPKVNETEYERWLTWLENGGTTAQWDQMSPTKRQNWYDSIVQSIPKKTKAVDIDTAQTSEEVQELMKQQGWFYVDGERYNGNELINITKADLNGAKDIYRGFEQTFTKYPQLKGKLSPPNVGTLDATVYADNIFGFGRGGITCNSKYYGNYDRLTRAVKRDLGFGFHPLGTDQSAVIVHEIGHAIDDMLTNLYHLNGSKYNSVSSELRAKVARKAGVSVRDMRKEVSEYSAKNAHEWFAECYAEYMTLPNPRKVATVFGEMLDEMMRGIE